MTGSIEALLYALLGAAIGGGVILAWRLTPRTPASALSPEPLPPGVAAVLAVLRSSALVVDGTDTVRKASAPAIAMGLVEDGRITQRELFDLVQEVRRDGQIREADLSLERTLGVPPLYVTVRVAPLTSRHVLALVDDRTQERLVESIRRDFVANVSHELKTPVGAIKLLADAVTDAADDPEAVQRFAGRMQKESLRLTRLVQQVIDLSRLQGDNPMEQAGEVRADEVLARALDDHLTDATARDITLIQDHDRDEDLRMRGDAEEIGLAVSNLVANAITYSPDGSRVVVSAERSGEYVDISVTDQGIGIPAHELDRIFERFYRVDPARHRSTGGTGLGLSIVKHVVASHGGEVDVWSVEGQGSTFTLRFPRKTGTVVEGTDS